jgi:hypothetical protein
MTESYYSDKALSLMASQYVEAKAQGDPRCFFLLMALSQALGQFPEHIEHQILNLILPEEQTNAD